MSMSSVYIQIQLIRIYPSMIQNGEKSTYPKLMNKSHHPRVTAPPVGYSVTISQEVNSQEFALVFQHKCKLFR
jgi:hypothetical protein